MGEAQDNLPNGFEGGGDRTIKEEIQALYDAQGTKTNVFVIWILVWVSTYF